MGMTVTEKILAAHAELDKVRPGQLVTAKVDLAMGSDATAPLAIEQFERFGASKVFDPTKVMLVPDHFAPNKDIGSAEKCKQLRQFARKHNLVHYYELGEMGILHVLAPEQGLVAPGELIVGADSHTTTHGALGAFATGVGSTDLAATMISGRLWFRVPPTIKVTYRGVPGPWAGAKDFILETIARLGVEGARYKALEFAGPVLAALSMDGRFTMAGMAAEAGAKNAVFPVDEKTRAYLDGRVTRPYTVYDSDPDAEYETEMEVDVSGMEPMVALPHLPSNVKPVSQAGNVPLQQAVIGCSCNSRIGDLREAAAVLKGRGRHPEMRLIIIPGTPTVYREALREGLIETFLDAGAVISTPTRGPCLGGHMGVLAAGERAVATSNRNYVGGMGHPDSEVYLANPAVAAASAVAGRLVGPEALGL